MSLSKVKISISGPESTGKTTIARQLAEHFQLPLVEEYAREYFEVHPINHDYETIVHIAREQMSRERAAMASHPAILCDTDMYNLKIWLRYYDHHIPEFIDEFLHEDPYSFCLLLYPNIPWVADKQRANPHDRLALFYSFEQELQADKLDYHIVKSIGEYRLQDSIAALEKILLKA